MVRPRLAWGIAGASVGLLDTKPIVNGTIKSLEPFQNLWGGECEISESFMQVTGAISSHLAEVEGSTNSRKLSRHLPPVNNV